MSISLKLSPNTRFGYIVILLESLETNKKETQVTMLKKDLNIAKKKLEIEFLMRKFSGQEFKV